MDPLSRHLLSTLVTHCRVASIGTLHDDSPFVSMVLAAPAPGHAEWFLHLSRLAMHTQDLLKDPRASLMLVQPDSGDTDPQQLARLTLVGKAFELADGSSEKDEAQAVYLMRFPHMAEIVERLADFSFWAFRPESARFVGGFARAFSMAPDALSAALSDGGKRV